MGGWFAKFEELVEPQELPGDPGTVRTAGHKYSHMAEQVLKAADSIRRLAADNGNHVSQAVDKLVDVAGDVGDKVEKLHSRYAAAGSALTAYAGHLEHAQHEAKAAVKAFYDAKGLRDAATAKADAADDEARAAGDDDAAKQDAKDKSTRLQTAAAGHQQDMDDARQRYLNAVRNLNAAAQAAHDQIADAINDDGLKDSRWDKLKNSVGNVVHAVGDFIKKHAAFFKALHKILSVITTALSIASIFFPVLAPFALGFAAATALVGLGLALTGEMSWLDFGMDALALVTLGVGTVASGVMKGAAAEGRAVLGALGKGGVSRFGVVARDLAMDGKSVLGGAASALLKGGAKKAGKDLLEFGLAKVPKWAALGKVESLGKDALSAENALGDVFAVMKARGLENFKNMSVLNAFGDSAKFARTLDKVAGYTGIANMVAHKAVGQYDKHTQFFNGIGGDARGLGKDLGKFMTHNPVLAGMRAGL